MNLANSEAVHPCKDINGMIPLSESFRPVDSTHTITDADGNVWNQIAANGYQRECDSFFWPGDPTNDNNQMAQLPPSVKEIATRRGMRSTTPAIDAWYTSSDSKQIK